MKKILYALVLSFLLLVFYHTEAQVAVNTDGSTADNSAALDIQSDSLGFLMPRLSNDQRNARMDGIFQQMRSGCRSSYEICS